MNDNNKAKTKTNGARPYLHVMPREATGGRWHVFQLSEEYPRISFAESVTSYLEAHKLATRDQRPLRFPGGRGSRWSPRASRRTPRPKT